MQQAAYARDNEVQIPLKLPSLEVAYITCCDISVTKTTCESSTQT
jgi:hypothetical protein